MKRSGWIKKRVRRRRRLRTIADGPTDKMLDDACRAVVFARDGHRCVKTGARTNLQWAHIYSRRYRSMRWDPENALTLAGGVHLWWHHKPLESAAWFMATFPGRAERLKLKSLTHGKVDKKLTLLWLQHELKKYQKVA